VGAYCPFDYPVEKISQLFSDIADKPADRRETMSREQASKLCGSIPPDRREYCETLAEQCLAQRKERAITYNLELDGENSLSLPNFDNCISYAKFRAKTVAPMPPVARKEPAKPEPAAKERAREKPPAKQKDAAKETSELKFSDRQAAADAGAQCEEMFDPNSAAMRSCVEHTYPCFSKEAPPFTLPFTSSTFPTRDRCLQFVKFYIGGILGDEPIKKSPPAESPPPARTESKSSGAVSPLKKADENAPLASFARLNFSMENSKEIRVEKMIAPFIHDKRQYGVEFTLGYFVEELGYGKYRIHYQAVPGKREKFNREELEKSADFTVEGKKILETLAFQFKLYHRGNFKGISSIEIVQL